MNDGKALNLGLHNERMNYSRKVLFGTHTQLHLEDYIVIPEEYKRNVVRCRIIYTDSFLSIEFSHYKQTKTRSLKLVDGRLLKYDHKYLDRNGLISLIDKNAADDILIVKDKCITDTSYSNIAFTDGLKWYTPDTPLLPGTMRKLLLHQGLIEEKRITTNDIHLYTHFRMINAMLGFDAPMLPVSNIL